VWSVWSKTLELYISATGSMLKAPGQPALLVPHPATLPLDRVLLLITEAINANLTNNKSVWLKNSKLRVTLGGSICPPLACQVPAGINNAREFALIANNTAAQKLGIPAADLACEWDSATPNVLSAMPRWWIESLQEWAGRQHANVVSIQPLWAVATACKLARHKAIHGLCLYEDDGVISLTNPHIVVDDISILKMKFSLTTQPQLDPHKLQNGPSIWQQHWYTA
jgi:hypothetical protein